MTEAPTRRAPHRRAVLTTAAWAAPLATVAVAAPAFAASPCADLRTGAVPFTAGGNYTRTANASGSASASLGAGATPVVLTLSSELLDGPPGTGNQRTDYAYTVGNANGNNFDPSPNGLLLLQALNPGALTVGGSTRPSDNSSSYGQRVTFSFDRPVYDLRFRVAGFNGGTAANNNFRDAGWLSVPPTAAVKSSTVLAGVGTAASPWIAPAAATNHHVDVVYTGPVTTFDLHYYNASGGSTFQQAIQVSGMSFSAFAQPNCGV